jgi:hypothetical protein
MLLTGTFPHLTLLLLLLLLLRPPHCCFCHFFSLPLNRIC